MALEAMKAIETSEQQAVEKLAEAQKEATKIVKDTEDKISLSLSQLEQDLKQKKEALLKTAEEKANEEIKTISQKYEEEKEGLKSKAEARMGKAVDFIIERIVNSDG